MTNIIQHFSQVASAVPNNIAVDCVKGSLTYAQLDHLSNIFAHNLLALGIKQGDAIAMVWDNRNHDFVIAMLGTLKAGCLYVPLDPNAPPARQKLTLESAKCQLLIHNLEGQPAYAANIRMRHITSFLKPLENTRSLPQIANTDPPAYVMFTSGSTGDPKGAIIRQQAVVRLVRNSGFISVAESDRFLQLAPLAFDASTFEIWAPLLNGATLVIYPSSRFDPNIVSQMLADKAISVLWLTAGLFHIYVSRHLHALAGLRVLLAGGDVLNTKHVQQVLQAYPNLQLINGYGPTENTTFTCCHVMTSVNVPTQSVPIGKPINGTFVVLLDGQGQTVPTGKVGELHAGGKGLALGYLDEHATAASFIQHPEFGRLYKSGDLAYQRTNGNYYFAGRADNQIKVNGYRISLEEIQQHLCQLEEVTQALVVVEYIRTEKQFIKALIAVKDPDSVNVKDLRHKLEQTVPPYLIPQQFEIQDTLDLNRNGKLSRPQAVLTHD